MFEATLADEIRADIRNKLSPISTYISLGLDEQLLLPMRIEMADRAADSLKYVLEK